MTPITADLLAQVLALGILTGGMYALMASGLTLIFGVMRIINLAHGALLVLSAYLTYWLWSTLGVDPLLSVLATVPVLFGLGVAIQQTMLTRIANSAPSLAVLLTFALALLIEGVLATAFTSSYRAVRPSYAGESLSVGDLYLPVTRVVGFAGALVTLGLFYFVVMRTSLGRAIRATMQDRRAAQLIGINTDRVAAVAFGLGVATAAVGGALLSTLGSFFPATHYLWISRLLAIIVLGGLGSLPGALVAALSMGVVEQGAALFFTQAWAPVVFYLFLFGTLILRPQGLFGEKLREGI